jgi:Domain of unknown function (DUF4360)
MVKLLAVVCAALFSCLAIAPASARAAVPDQSPGFTVTLDTANGSGCPPGSTAVSAPDDQSFTVTYSQYTADAGGGANPGDFRKNCQLDVLVGVPSGWTYGIDTVEYRGFANLDTGVQAQLEADYYFSDQPGTFTQNQLISGPTSGVYDYPQQVPDQTLARCRTAQTLNIDTSLEIFPGTTTPAFFDEITMDSTDVGVATIFHLRFHRC